MDRKTLKMDNPWSEVTESEINAVIRKDCAKCRYSAASCTGTKNGAGMITCIYILITGHMRPCRPGECRETGVFVSKSTKRHRPYLK